MQTTTEQIIDQTKAVGYDNIFIQKVVVLPNKKVKFEKLCKEAKQPFKARDSDAGYDLSSVERVSILPGQRKLIKTGIKIQIPEGYYGRIAPRSGLALKNGIDVFAGVVDQGYTGELGVILYNSNQPNSTGDGLFKPDGTLEINIGDRIAQLIIEPYINVDFVECDFDPTSRGENGFGSSGKN